MTESLYIAVDFDGTCVTHAYPEIGKDIGAIPVLKELVNAGHKLILYTGRCNLDIVIKGNGKGILDSPPGDYLSHAVNWFESNGIPLYGINDNPEQAPWDLSRKVFAHLYIDDLCVGAPLINDPAISKKPFINWVQVKNLLIEMKVL